MSDFTTVRVGQLVETVFSGTDNIPHEVGTELKRGTIADLATYISSIIDANAGLAFNPLKISDGQTLPETTINEWIIVGKGTYLQSGGFSSITCIDDINIITSNGNSWILSFGFNLEVPENISERFPTNTPNTTIQLGGIPPDTVIANRTAIDVLTDLLVVYLNPTFTSFVMSQSTLIEVGVALSGTKTFTWTTSNSTNIISNMLLIRDVTSGVAIGSGLNNDGSEDLNIGTITNTVPITRNWRIEGLNTNNIPFNSSNYTVNSIYPIFFGISNSVPTANQALIDSGTKQVVQSTGNLNITFGASGQYLWFAHPASNTTKTKWYVNALNNGNIGTISDLFNAPTSVSIDSPTVMWNGIAYKIYISNFPTTTAGNMELKNS